MQVLVVRHAIAEQREEFARTGKDDSQRPLTDDGPSFGNSEGRAVDVAGDLLELAAHMEADAIVISSGTLITSTTSGGSARSVLRDANGMSFSPRSASFCHSILEGGASSAGYSEPR